MEFVQRWPGVWTEGKNAGLRGAAIAFRASNLYTQADSDPTQHLFGPPSDFRVEDGRSGEVLLVDLMPFPRVDEFRYGCVREAILAAHWHAVLGSWCGNANYSQGLYYVDNQIAAIFPTDAPARAEGIVGISDAEQYIDIIKTSERSA